MNHTAVEAYCVLCRQSCPLEQGQTDGARAACPWETDLLCILRVPASGCETSRKWLDKPAGFRVQYGHYRWERTDPRLVSFIHRHELDLCTRGQSCRACDPEWTVHFAHVQCYQMARGMFPDLSLQRLAEMTQLLRPVFALRHVPAAFDRLREVATPVSSYTDLCYDTELGRLIRGIEMRLPTEIQTMIWSHSPGILRSLARASRTVSTYYPLLSSEKAGPYSSAVHRPLETGENITQLSVEVVDVLGERCIREISTDSNPSQNAIDVSNKPVSGVQFGYGSYGLTSLRVLYHDGTQSSWLGQKGTTFKTCRGRLHDLQTHFDGLKLIGAELSGSAHNTPSPPSQLALWNEESHPVKDRLYSMVDSQKVKSNILGNPASRMVQYVSLEGIQSLTIFCGDLGLHSIQVDGDASRRFGNVEFPYVVPVTYYFNPGETISMLSLLTYGRGDMMLLGPCLAMVTSHGRSLFYGPHHLVYSQRTDMTTFRSENEDQIVGLFIDPTTAFPTRIQSVGVATEPRTTLSNNASSAPKITLPAIESVDSSMFAVQHFRTAFMSTASLADVKTLRVQTRDDRCLGLYIEHHSGAQEVLGRWNPALEECTVDLYRDDGPNAPIEALTFVFSDELKSTDRHCKSIILGRDESMESPTFVYDNFKSELVWWFTRHHDLVEFGQGITTDLDDRQGQPIPTAIVQ